MELTEADAATPTHPDICQRMTRSSKAKFTKHYVAKHDGIEVGFVAMDVIPGVDYLVLYEIFIIASFRGVGLGALLLSQVEHFADLFEYARVTVFPTPIEPPFPAQRLVAWYKRNGYSERADCPSELEKMLSRSSAWKNP